MDVDLNCVGDSIVIMIKRMVVGGYVRRKSDVIGMRGNELMPEFDDLDSNEDI